jgi:hypothetical protein
MPPHSAGAALAGHESGRDRRGNAFPCLADAFGQAEHPRPEQFVILDPVPRHVAEHNEAVRRSYLEVIFYQHEINSQLRDMPPPERPGGLPKICDRTQLLGNSLWKRPMSRSSLSPGRRHRPNRIVTRFT